VYNVLLRGGSGAKKIVQRLPSLEYKPRFTEKILFCCGGGAKKIIERLPSLE
jgi:hypothetical protein